MSKPKLEFKKVSEDGIIPEYEAKGYALRTSKPITVVVGEWCYFPLGITADIPEGWHLVFKNAPDTESKISIGDDGEWKLSLCRKFSRVLYGLEPYIEWVLIDGDRKQVFNLEAGTRLAFVHLEEDE